MRSLFVCALLALTAARAAADCDPKAKPIYKSARTELRGKGVEALSISASGAWTHDADHGCLTPARLKLVEAAIAAATFTTNDKAKRCRVAPMKHAVYEAPGRKLKVEHDEPCGVPFDATTTTLIACADAATNAAISDGDTAATCKP
jgi:hypothetical protein